MATLYDVIQAEEENLSSEEKENETAALDGVKDDSEYDGDEHSEQITEESADVKEEEDVQEEPEKLDNSAYARMRREKSAAEKRAKELEDRLAQIEQRFSASQAPVQQQASPAQNVPDINEDPAGYLAWQNQQLAEKVTSMEQWKTQQEEVRQRSELERAATNEFLSYESEAKSLYSDYDDVAEAFTAQVAQSMKLMNPNLSNEELASQVRMHILQRSGAYARQGLNPAEELYHFAKEIGVSPVQRTQRESSSEQMKTSNTPDLRKIDSNRKRSATGLSGKGSSTSALSLDEVSRMSPAQLMKVDPELLRTLEREAGIV